MDWLDTGKKVGLIALAGAVGAVIAWLAKFPPDQTIIATTMLLKVFFDWLTSQDTTPPVGRSAKA